MKLYYSPGTCSLASHIVLREAGFDFELEKVDLRSKQTESGKDFKSISDKGYVPFLVLDNQESLSEGVAIIQYLADQKPGTGLLPPAGSLERARVQEWLNYIATEVHKQHSPLFNPAEAVTADIYRAKIGKAFDYLSGKLNGKSFLVGDTVTVADIYLFVVLGWGGLVNINLADWPVLTEYRQKIAQRPKVQAALKAEALI
jgi:glutathione S-transferase